MNTTEQKLTDIYRATRKKENYVIEFTQSDFKRYIAVGFLINPPINVMIGKVVQIRKEWGAFGSDQIFLRCQDGLLQVHENQHFYFVPEEFKKELDELFKTVPDKDNPNDIYSLMNKNKRAGFIVPSKIKDGE